MNKLLKITSILAMGAMVCGLAACGCNKTEETTTAEELLTLPMDYFDDYSERDRLDAIQKDIDAIDELQKNGVDTDEKQAAYDEAVNDLLDKGPEYKDIVDEGKEEHKIDTDKLQEKHDEQVAESIAESASAESEAESIAESLSEAIEQGGSDAESASKEAESVAESLSDAVESATDENGNYTLPYSESEIQLPTVKIK